MSDQPQISAATPDGSSLVVEATPIRGRDGAGIFHSGQDLLDTVRSGEDWDVMSLAADGLAAGMDVLSMVLNPLGALVKAGVGWLMEHVWFLREPLEVLTGDFRQIEGVAQTWNNIAAAVQGAGQAYNEALQGVQGWEGDAAEAYRGVASSTSEALGHVGAYAQDVAKGISVAGILVATTRAIVFDLIAEFISKVITRALIALASSWCTFGASLAAFAASVAADACIVAGKTTSKVAKVMEVLEKFAKRFSKMKGSANKVSDAFGNFASRLHSASNAMHSRSIDFMGTSMRGLQNPNAFVRNYSKYTTKVNNHKGYSFDSDGLPTPNPGSGHLGTQIADNKWSMPVTETARSGVNTYDEEFSGEGGDPRRESEDPYASPGA